MIVDVIEPGGNRDLYAELNREEMAAFGEVTKTGFPLRA